MLGAPTWLSSFSWPRVNFVSVLSLPTSQTFLRWSRLCTGGCRLTGLVQALWWIRRVSLSPIKNHAGWVAWGFGRCSTSPKSRSCFGAANPAKATGIGYWSLGSRVGSSR